MKLKEKEMNLYFSVGHESTQVPFVRISKLSAWNCIWVKSKNLDENIKNVVKIYNKQESESWVREFGRVLSTIADVG